MAKKVLIGLPPSLLAQVDYVAEAEHRTRSDLMREALRRYVASFRLPDIASCVQSSTDGQCAATSATPERQYLEQSYALSSRVIN